MRNKTEANASVLFILRTRLAGMLAFPFASLRKCEKFVKRVFIIYGDIGMCGTLVRIN
jgi:hypothetical protein